jgi:hypothetical protein
MVDSKSVALVLLPAFFLCFLSSHRITAVPQFQQTNTFVDPRAFSGGTRNQFFSSRIIGHQQQKQQRQQQQLDQQEQLLTAHETIGLVDSIAANTASRTSAASAAALASETRIRSSTNINRRDKNQRLEAAQHQYQHEQHDPRNTNVDHVSADVTPVQGPILLKNGSMPVIPLYSYPTVYNGTFYQIPVR